MLAQKGITCDIKLWLKVNMKLRRRPSSSLPSLFLSQSIEIVNALDFGAKIVTLNAKKTNPPRFSVMIARREAPRNQTIDSSTKDIHG